MSHLSMIQHLPGFASRRHRLLATTIAALLSSALCSVQVNAQAFPANLHLGTLNGENGFRLDGGSSGDLFGTAVSAAGDLNGDGLGDLLIGADGMDPDGREKAGSSYIVFGRRTPFAAIVAATSLDGANGFRIDGVAPDDHSGRSVSAAGDLNGDGLADLVIGADAAGSNSSFAGSSYVVFGKTTPFAATLPLSSLDGSNGFRIDGSAAGDSSGRSVSAAGDINGDGFDDLVVGAPGADPNAVSSAGSSYVIFGKSTPFSAALAPADLDGSNGFRIDGVAMDDRSGSAVSGAGDLNGDGFDDLIVGAPMADPNGAMSGSGYLVFGHAAPFAATLGLSGLNGATGFRFDGLAADERLGASVSGAGDINGDGLDDLIISAYQSGASGTPFSGSSYVILGQTTPFAATLALSSLDGSNGFRIDGAGTEGSGRTVRSGGDVNADGLADLIIGTLISDPNGVSGAGSTFVVFGRSTPVEPTLALSSLDGSNGVRLDGTAISEFSGRAASAAGDVNGDGIDDVLVGALGASVNGFANGSAFVVFGRSADAVFSSGFE